MKVYFKLPQPDLVTGAEWAEPITLAEVPRVGDIVQLSALTTMDAARQAGNHGIIKNRVEVSLIVREVRHAIADDGWRARPGGYSEQEVEHLIYINGSPPPR